MRPPRPAVFLTASAASAYVHPMRFSISIDMVIRMWPAAGVIWTLGCKEPVYNYSECVQIETARCNVRAECKINEDEEFRDAYPDFDRETCVAYAKEHCKTRKIAGKDWDQDNVDACVAAISNLSCKDLVPRGVDETEKLRSCNFIDVFDTSDENEEETEDTVSDSSGDESDTESTGGTDPKDAGD